MLAALSKMKSFYDYLRYGKEGSKEKGYGTFYGVYLPGALTMFGVIIFLRLGWITGSVGLTGTILIITLSCLIVFLTALSIASASTNMKMEGGGTYYMISRALGIEIGSAIGIPLWIAQTLTISFCAMGFAESISPLLPNVPLNQIAITAVCGMMLLNFSTGIALNTQLFIFLIMAASLVSLFMGHPIPESENIPSFDEKMQIPFWAGFAVFFPAATGIEAGLSMSGDLHSPRKSLPIGTIAVLITGFVVYLSLSYFFWTHAPRSLLVTDELIAVHASRIPALITIGIWAATLSSILAGLIAAPRTLQAIAKDRIVPQILGREFGKTKEPRLAAFFCFLFSLVGIWYGSINQIASILTMFYLIAYAMLNLSTGLEALLHNPSWRPSFKIPWYVSILGFVFCVMAMLMIDTTAAFVSIAFVMISYTYVKRKRISNRWEDIRHGVLMFMSRFAIYRLSSGDHSMRSWRPNFIVFSANPTKLTNIIDLTSAITNEKGFLTISSVFPPSMADPEKAERWKKFMSQFLVEKNIKALVEFSIDSSFFKGAKKFLTTYGIGPITPNTVVLGTAQNQEALDDYLQVLEHTSQNNKNIILLKETEQLQPKTKIIDIWWDDQSKKNSELMILLSHMLSTNKVWQGSTIRLKSLVLDENGRKQRASYFHSFLETSRIAAIPEIYVQTRNDEGVYKMAASHSKDADIVFFGFQSRKADESSEEFKARYLNMQETTERLNHVAFVNSGEQIELSEIFK